MRITQMQQVLEIAKCKSISRAARNLYVSQPSLSIILNELEEEIGVKIFERSSTGVIPTPDGENILTTLKEIVDGVEKVKAYSLESQELTGEITLYIGPAYSFLIPEIAQRFKSICPKVTLYFEDNTTRFPNLSDKVIKHQCNFAIGTVDFKSTHIISEPIAQVGLALFINTMHPLSSQSSIKLEDLYQEQLIIADSAVNEELHKTNFYQRPFEKTPLFLTDRFAAFRLIQNNTAVLLSASPLHKLTYEKDHSFVKIIPFSDQLNSSNWQTYLFYSKKRSGKLEALLLKELKKLLHERELL